MIAETLRSSPVDAVRIPTALPGETVSSNPRWRRTDPVLSILVPVYRYDSSALISGLAACQFADRVELILYDDGSSDPELTAKLEAGLLGFPGAGCLVTAETNIGRSGGRNRLQSLARSDWMLFLDADMIPDDAQFLARYLRLIREYGQPVLAVGGFSLLKATQSGANALHFRQCAVSECVPAAQRMSNPGRYVFTSNVLVHKDIMTVVPFDPDFRGWGWEDVDWGLRAARRFPVLHLDNTATHVGLDPVPTLIRKYAGSGANFWLAAERHPDALKSTGLYRMAVILSYLPGRTILKHLCSGVARLPGFLAPVSLRLLSLKLFRALVYAEARHDVR